MPRRDGTGPMGAVAITGRGLGICTGVSNVRYGTNLGMGLGLGFGCRRGCRRNGNGRHFNENKMEGFYENSNSGR